MLMYEKAISFYHFVLASQAFFALQLEGFSISLKTANTENSNYHCLYVFGVANKSYEMLEV